MGKLRMPTSALLPMGGAVPRRRTQLGADRRCGRLVNPLNGEGIDYGLESGRLVAEMIADGGTSRPMAGAAAPPLRRVLLHRPTPRRPGDRPVRARHPRPARHALRLADDPRAAVDGQPGHGRGPRPRRPGLALGRPSVPRARPPTAVLRARSEVGGRRRADRPQVRKVQRVAAYAVILRDDRHPAASRLSKRLTSKELWTLPGGGVSTARTPATPSSARSTRRPASTSSRRDRARLLLPPAQHLAAGPARRLARAADRLRRLGAYRRAGARVVEVDGSTAEAAWKPLAEVLDGTVPVALVTEVLTRTGRTRCSGCRRTR